MDAEISKLIQKILSKQGMKFKLNTKVTNGDDSGEGVKVNVEAAQGGKEETVRLSNLFIGFHPLTFYRSSMQMSYWSPLAEDLTPQASTSKTLD